MTNAGVNVVHMVGHGLDWFELRAHQPFGDHAPMAYIGGEPQGWMGLEDFFYGPGIEQAAAAVRFQTHRYSHWVGEL